MMKPFVPTVETAPFFIAEVSSNHSASLDRCLEFVDAAARIGCDAVKFQLFRIRELFAPEVLESRSDLLNRTAWELPPAYIPEIAARARVRGVRFGCTPFYLEAVEELRPHVDFYKIASYELLWTDLLIACAGTGLPVVLSTGMADLGEVREAVTILKSAGCGPLTLLHCVSGYPAPPLECNLAAIQTLRRECGCPAGWSDHSRDPDVIHRAALKWNASIIEFHLDLDGKGAEHRAGHCWLPEQMAPVIAGLRGGAAADGSGAKEPAPAEQADRDWRADPGDGLRPLRHMRAAVLVSR
jgi:N-acetylneuraminate synthase